MADPKKIWSALYEWLNNPYGVAGLMGNLYAESALEPTNLQNSANTRLGMSDKAYTEAVDNGSYTNFVRDSAGYGLAQWTYWSRKQSLLNYAKQSGKSVGDLDIQLAFLKKELTENYSGLVTSLKSAKSVQAASDAVLTKFEQPADQSQTVKNTRASYGQKYFNEYGEVKTVAYYIGEASHDERGQYYYGQAGDQTGTEAAMRTWYSYPWNVVLRPKDSELARKSANAMIDACNNNKIGYDMGQRNTAYTQWKKYGSLAKIATACETDCSALTSLCITEAGLDILSGRSNAPVTATLRGVLLSTGKYTALSGSYLTSPSLLKRGDVLLKEGSHVCIFLGTSKSKVGTSSTPSYKNVDITYAVQVEGGKYYPAVKNLEDYAGVEKKKIIGITMKVSRGSVKYRTHRIGGSWGGWVTGSDFTFKDPNKYSGDGKKPIDLIEAVYTTPKGELVKYLYYKVSPINSTKYWDYQKDTITGSGYDGFAGSSNVAIDKLQMYVG